MIGERVRVTKSLPTRDDRPYLVISRNAVECCIVSSSTATIAPSIAHESNQQYISQVVKDTGMDTYPLTTPISRRIVVAAHLNIYE
jgi:hypothetical protein